MIDERDAKIEVLERRNGRLEEERDELLKRIHGEIGFRAMDPDGTLRIDPMTVPDARGVMATIAQSLVMTLGDAPNYVTMRAHSPDTGWIEITVQRAGAMTPAEGRRKAEAECARMLEFIRANGLSYELAIELRPEWYQPIEAEATSVGADWLAIDCRQKPNKLLCKRCGATEEIPDPVTKWVYQAMSEKFNDFHGECKER